MDLETKSLVVQGSYGIADHQVCQLADRFQDDPVRLRDRLPGQCPGDPRRRFRIDVEDHSTFDVAAYQHHRRYALSPVRLFLHRHVADLRRALQHLCKHRIGGIDERLDQVHLHWPESPPATAAAASVMPSSPSTYLITSYSTSGFTGFCTKCRAPFCSAATMFSW